MRAIRNIFTEKTKTYSFEFFTPKTSPGFERLFENAREIYNTLTPDFFSVTYGAGGSTREGTMYLVDTLQQQLSIPVMHHLTCINHSKQELAAILDELYEKNIANVLALRGDPPAGESTWEPHPDGFEYSSQLCRFIRSKWEDLSVGVAGFPEGHPESPDLETDVINLKKKIDAGGEFVITQFFFTIEDYFRYRELADKHGIHARIIPGVLPITNYHNLLRFTDVCKANVPDYIHRTFGPIEDDPEATFHAGVEAASRLCTDLLDAGAPGLHFYTVNRARSVVEICKNVGCAQMKVSNV